MFQAFQILMPSPLNQFAFGGAPFLLVCFIRYRYVSLPQGAPNSKRFLFRLIPIRKLEAV